MTPDTEQPSLTIDELAARAGLTVRTVRFYGTKGLLPPPVIGPRRVGRYDAGHLARLALIEELQRQGMTLAAIERYLSRLPPDLSAQDLAVHRAVVASWAPEAGRVLTRAELGGRAGRPLTDEELDRLAAMGVLERLPDETASGAGDGGGPARVGPAGTGCFRVDLGLLGLGVELLDVPLAEEAVLKARTVLLEHGRQAARELSRLFRDEVSRRDADDVKSLSAHMQPLVVQALLTAFQRSLTQEVRAWIGDSTADERTDDDC